MSTQINHIYISRNPVSTFIQNYRLQPQTVSWVYITRKQIIEKKINYCNFPSVKTSRTWLWVCWWCRRPCRWLGFRDTSRLRCCRSSLESFIWETSASLRQGTTAKWRALTVSSTHTQRQIVTISPSDVCFAQKKLNCRAKATTIARHIYKHRLCTYKAQCFHIFHWERKKSLSLQKCLTIALNQCFSTDSYQKLLL